MPLMLMQTRNWYSFLRQVIILDLFKVSESPQLDQIYFQGALWELENYKINSIRLRPKGIDYLKAYLYTFICMYIFTQVFKKYSVFCLLLKFREFYFTPGLNPDADQNPVNGLNWLQVLTIWYVAMKSHPQKLIYYTSTLSYQNLGNCSAEHLEPLGNSNKWYFHQL